VNCYYLLYDLDKVFEQLVVVRLPSPPVGDDSRRQVAQNVRTHRLDCIQVPAHKTVCSTVNLNTTTTVGKFRNYTNATFT